SPVLEIFRFQFEAVRIDGHHEIISRSGKNQQLVFWIRPDSLQHLSKRAVVFDAQLNGASEGVCLRQNDAIGAALQFEVLLESLLIVFKPGSWDKLGQRHDLVSV